MKQKYIKDDIVYIDGSIRTIKQSDDYYATFYNDNIKWQEVKNVNDIKGIPITPEILEKNEWKFTNIGTSLYQYYKDDIYIKYDKLEEKFKFDDLYWSAYSFEIPYVHTLQHLLFGLGLKSEMEVQV